MLIDRLRQEQLAARRADQGQVAALLGTLIGDAVQAARRVENREPTDEEILGLVRKYVKNAQETKAAAAARADVVEAMDREIALLTAYLPRQLDRDELAAIVTAFKDANPGANKGQVMAFLKANHAGLYDGRMASDLAG